MGGVCLLEYANCFASKRQESAHHILPTAIKKTSSIFRKAFKLDTL